ncbi:hypothetical protein [Parasporobacterium paucivorans]|nr:hypothetical protein [Parasporobacterium paucivorans]
MINNQPTVYDVDKVVENLEAITSNIINHEHEEFTEQEVYGMLVYFIETVKGGGIDG